jgi:hypothetical protein
MHKVLKLYNYQQIGECLNCQIAAVSYAMHTHNEWHVVSLKLHYDPILHPLKNIDSICPKRTQPISNVTF